MEHTNNANDNQEDSAENKEETSNYKEEWEAYDKIKDKETKTNQSSSFYNVRKINTSDIKSYLGKNSNHGLTGLQNLGNTCFMNSALQCMSHSLDLTCFYLSKDYKKEINVDNILGQSK